MQVEFLLSSYLYPIWAFCDLIYLTLHPDILRRTDDNFEEGLNTKNTPIYIYINVTKCNNLLPTSHTNKFLYMTLKSNLFLENIGGQFHILKLLLI
jgi:hypothetical protein